MRNCDGKRLLTWNLGRNPACDHSHCKRDCILAAVRPEALHAGSGAVLALMIVRLDAAIAAPPGARADRPPFPGLHRHGGAMLRMDARGVTGIFAPCRRPCFQHDGSAISGAAYDPRVLAPAHLVAVPPAHVCTRAVELGWRDFMRPRAGGDKQSGNYDATCGRQAMTPSVLALTSGEARQVATDS